MPLEFPGCVDSTNSLPQAVTTVCGPDLCLDLTDPGNAALGAVNGSLFVQIPSGDVLLLIRTSTTSVLALSAICTHAGCLVDFDSSQQVLACPCHGSVFGENGQVLRGPARLPLQVYPAVLSGSQLKLTLG